MLPPMSSSDSAALRRGTVVAPNWYVTGCADTRALSGRKVTAKGTSAKRAKQLRSEKTQRVDHPNSRAQPAFQLRRNRSRPPPHETRARQPRAACQGLAAADRRRRMGGCGTAGAWEEAAGVGGAIRAACDNRRRSAGRVGGEGDGDFAWRAHQGRRAGAHPGAFGVHARDTVRTRTDGHLPGGPAGAAQRRVHERGNRESARMVSMRMRLIAPECCVERRLCALGHGLIGVG
jgi:hypothetical protein